ncbi:MAG: Bug family tripartite tricarboxylate transporter substrate binding protein [Burkholderiaceae bacterium]
MSKKYIFALMVQLACGLDSIGVQAQILNWPDKPIRIIVPYTPGGGTDTVTRQLAERISAEQKWSFIIDNKPGGGGNIGLEITAKAKADGYTLGMGQTANLAINPAAMSKMSFDAQKDLIAIALIAEQPTILVVKENSPFKNLADLMKAAKNNSTELKLASAGSGTVGHLAGELLAKRADFKFLHIPYKGAAPAITDLLGDQTDLMFATPQAVLGLIRSEKLRALAVTSSKRMAVLPEIASMAQSGYPNFQAVDWKVLVAPSSTPVDILQKLNSSIERALAQSQFIEQLKLEGSAPMGGNLAKVQTYVREEQAQWSQIVKAANIRLEP